MKQVAVAILNWNGQKFLRQFLPGVMEHSASVADVVVIDNGSTDHSIAILEGEFPSVKIVRLAQNLGFAGGYNEGLAKLTEYKYFILLNSDVEVTPNWIEPVLQFMERTPGMVACQPKILDYHRKEWFEYAGAAGGYMDKDGYAFCAGRIFFAFEKDHGQYNQDKEVFWSSGAAMFIESSAWFHVKGLDETFFAHMEEIDLCWRLKNRGFKVGYCHSSTVYHYGGGTLDRHSPTKTYLNFRNNLLMILKNDRRSNLWLRLARRLILDGIAGLRLITEGKFIHCIAVVRAHGSFYRRIPTYLKHRRVELSQPT
ncbi:MAG: glycosyltransferase family 2 protein, partial [Flavobacteriales bacterium]